MPPWERYQQQAAPQADPIIATDPYKVEDQQMQRDAAGRAAQDQALQEQRFQITQQREEVRDVRAAKKDAEGSESERTAGFLAGNAKDAALRMAAAINKNQDAIAPSLGVEAVRRLPVIGGMAANKLSDAERQQVRAAELAILDAALTLGTGAAYTPLQLESYREIYFPQISDADDTVLSKRAALRSLLVNARVKAGKSAPDMDEALAALDSLPAPGAKETAADDRDPERLSYNNPDMGDAGTVTDVGAGLRPIGDPSNRDPSGGSGLAALAKQGVTLGLSDEAAGIGGYLSGYLTGEDPATAYARERDAERTFLAKARSEWPVIGTAAEVLGGGGAARVAPGAMSLGSVMRQGAGLGSVGGFGYGEGAGSVPNALLGAGGGAVLGGALYGAGAGVNALSRPRGPINTDVIEAGQRQGINMRQPDVRPDMRGRYATAESGQTSGPLIAASRADDAAAIEARAQQVGGGTAFNRADGTAIGQSAQRIAERGGENVREAAGQMYTRVERAEPGFAVPGAQTIAAIDQQIAKFQASAPSGYTAEIQALQSMKDDIAKTGLSVETLQAQRHTVGGRIGDNIADRTRADAALTQALKTAETELHTALSAKNPQAAAMLKRADAKWGQFKTLQREVTTLFLGKRGDATAETAARQLGSLVNNKGNYSALRRFMTLATPEERADFATTFATNWGSDARGNFSPAMLAKNLGNTSDRNLNVLFGSEGRRAMRDLQAISNAKTDAMGRMSPSGKAISGMAGGLKQLLWGALGLSAGGADAAIASGATQSIIAKIGEQRTARMLLNPDFTKVLRQVPNSTNPRVIDRYFSRLAGTLAANDNQALTAAIRETFKSPAIRSAAEEQDAKER